MSGLSLSLGIGLGGRSSGGTPTPTYATLVFDSVTGIGTATFAGADSWAFEDEDGTPLTGTGNLIARADMTPGKEVRAIPDGNTAAASNWIIADPAPAAVYDDFDFSSIGGATRLSGWRYNNPSYNQGGSGELLGQSANYLKIGGSPAFAYQGYATVLGTTGAYYDPFFFTGGALQRTAGSLDPGTSTFYMGASLDAANGYRFTWKNVPLGSFTSSSFLPLTALGKWISGNGSSDLLVRVEGANLRFERKYGDTAYQVVPIAQTGSQDITVIVDHTTSKVRVLVGGVEPETAGIYVKGEGIPVNGATGTPLTLTGCRPGFRHSYAGQIPGSVNFCTGLKAEGLLQTYFSLLSQVDVPAELGVSAKCIATFGVIGSATNADWIFVDPDSFATIGSFATVAVSAGQVVVEFDATDALQGTAPTIFMRDSADPSQFNIVTLAALGYSPAIEAVPLMLQNGGPGDYYSPQNEWRNRGANTLPVPMLGTSTIIGWGTDTPKINKYGEIYGLPAGADSFFIWPFYHGAVRAGDYIITGNKNFTAGLLSVSGGIAITASGANWVKINVPDTTGQAWVRFSAVSYTDDPDDPFITNTVLESDANPERILLDTAVNFFNPATGFAGKREMKPMRAEMAGLGSEGYTRPQTDTVYYPPDNNRYGTPENFAKAAKQRGSTVTWPNFHSLMPSAVRIDFMQRHKAELDAQGLVGHRTIPVVLNEPFNSGTYPTQYIDLWRHAYNLGLFNGGVPPAVQCEYFANQVWMSTSGGHTAGQIKKACTAGQILLYEKLDYSSGAFATCILDAPVDTLITNTTYFTSTDLGSLPGYSAEAVARVQYLLNAIVADEAAAIYGEDNISPHVETFLLEDPDGVYQRLKWVEEQTGRVLSYGGSAYAGSLWNWTTAPAVYKTDLSDPTNMAAAVAAYKAQCIDDIADCIDTLKTTRQYIFNKQRQDGKTPAQCSRMRIYEALMHRFFYNVPLANVAGLQAMLTTAKTDADWETDVMGPFITALCTQVGIDDLAPFIDYDYDIASSYSLDGGTSYYVVGFGMVPCLADTDTGNTHFQAIRDTYLGLAA